jgi:hypothetical protein
MYSYIHICMTIGVPLASFTSEEFEDEDVKNDRERVVKLFIENPFLSGVMCHVGSQVSLINIYLCTCVYTCIYIHLYVCVCI